MYRLLFELLTFLEFNGAFLLPTLLVPWVHAAFSYGATDAGCKKQTCSFQLLGGSLCKASFNKVSNGNKSWLMYFIDACEMSLGGQDL